MTRFNALIAGAKAALCLSAAALCGAAFGGPTNYANRKVDIRAGVAIVDANTVAGYAANNAPFVWYNLLGNPKVAPAGWNFYNPHASTQVTMNINQRWAAMAAALGASGPTPVGSLITKNEAPYWEVPISQVADTSINDYDVLVLPVYGNLMLNPSERSKLQRFVDQGGVLWIDVTNTTTVDAGDGAPIAFTTTNTGPALPTDLNPVSPVVSYPYAVDQLPDAQLLSAIVPVNLAAAGFGNLIPVLQPVGPEFARFEVVGTAGPGGPPTALMARIGSGAVVVTCRGAAQFLNRAVFNGAVNANVGFTGISTSPDSDADLVGKFAIDAVNLVNGFSQDGQGPRKASATPIDLGAPLLSEWKDETTPGPMLQGQTPVSYKGLLLVAGANRLYAYSAEPGSDLDLDGNPDDGIPDYGEGRNRDLIWQSPILNGPLSAPAAMEVPNDAGGVSDQVYVVDGDGNLLAFNAFPLTAQGVFASGDNPVYHTYAPPNGSPVASVATIPPIAPTTHEGLVYVADNVENGLGVVVGRIWVVDPLNQNNVNDWSVGGQPNAPLFQISNSPTIGYIPIADGSGGVDEVVYAPYLPAEPSGTGAAGHACGVQSIWAATKGERHDVLTTAGPDGNGDIEVATRASANGRPVYFPNNPAGDARGLRLSLLTANGDTLTVAQMNSILTGKVTQSGTAGVFDYELTASGAGLITSLGVKSVAIDYSLDWDAGNPAVGRVVRGSVQFPDDASFSKSVVGQVAMSSAGTLYAVVANPTDGDSDGEFIALREQGQGLFTVVTRFDLYNAFTMEIPSATSSTDVPETFEDNDATQTIPGVAPFLGGPFQTVTFQTGPSVADGRVFVKARATKKGSSGFTVPCTILMCFTAEPQLPSFTVPPLSQPFTIFQPDYSRSNDKTAPEVFTQLNSGQVNYIAGLDHATISMNSLATAKNNSIALSLSESLPIVIRQNNQPDLTIDPSSTGVWSSLQWYTVFYGLDPGATPGSAGSDTMTTGPAVVTGNTVFTAANSYLPYIFQGQNPFGKTPTGMLVGYDAALSPDSDPFAVNNVSRPYFRQITQLETVPGFAVNPDMVWPQAWTSSSFTEWEQRLYQTVLDGANLVNAPSVFGLSAGNGELFAYSNLGVYGFKRADFTVADEGRLASFDPAGNAMWSSDQSYSYGLGTPTSGAPPSPAVSHPLVRPTRAYPVGTSDYVVADPGANRVARIDRTGRELRSIESFSIDPAYRPDGMRSGEPQTLNQPQDVLTFSGYVQNSPFTNPQPLEYWTHYLIADTGNRRLVEIVDRYYVDPTTRKPGAPIALGVLYWHSPANLSGKGYDYNTVARLDVPGTSPLQFVYACSLGTSEPSLVGQGLVPPTRDLIPSGATGAFQARDARDGNGGILVINGAATTVINQVVVPALAAGTIYDPATGTFNAQPIPAQYKKLGNLTSVTMSYYYPDSAATPQLRIMFTDSTGVYEIAQAANPIKVNGQPTDWVVEWMLPASVYTQLRRDPGTNLPNQSLFLNAMELRATYARRTAAGTVLVVNGYYGIDQDAAQTPFAGEIIELEGDDYAGPGTRGFSPGLPFLGFDSLSVRFQLPSVHGARGIIAPIFADRR